MIGDNIQKYIHEISQFTPVLDKGLVSMETHGTGCGMITPSQFAMLTYIMNSPDCKMSDLGKAFDVKLSSITGMIDRLENEGFLKRTRDAADRRVVHVNVTAKGDRAVKDMKQKQKKHMSFILELLTDNERQCMVNIIRKISDAIKKDKEERGIK